MNRRTFLQTVTVGAGGLGLAGCLGSGGEPIQIASIEIVNSNGQTHSLALDVVFDGDVVVNERLELADGETTDPIERTLPEEEGRYEITADPETLDASTFVPGEQTEADCGSLRIELLRDQVLQRFSDDCDSE